MIQTTLTPTWPEMKQMASEFFKTLPTATPEETSAGFKCLTLAYLGLIAPDYEMSQAAILLELASRKMDEHLLGLKGKTFTSQADYRELLVAYMKLVASREGTTFVPSSEEEKDLGVYIDRCWAELSLEQRQILRDLSDEAYKGGT